MHAFESYVKEWIEARETLALEAVVSEAGGPEHVALFCVDVINGFCHIGPLHSERVRGIIAPIVHLFTAAYQARVRHFVLPQDAHAPDASEFAFYPPHCVRDTEESQTVPELLELPFASQFTILPKNSIHSALGTGLNAWVDSHPEVTHRIVVGDCTDLCTYQLAMHLHLRALAANQTAPVILPIDCVDTYDVPVETAKQLGIPAHPAEVLHPIFLYNMAMNGIHVVKTLS